MDQLAAIRVFLRTVETGSLSRAAARLSMPKSTASKLLAELESHLGVKLLFRSTRAVSLTEDGASYYRETSRIVGDLADIDADLRDHDAEPHGRLRVDVHSTMANSILIPALGEFCRSYPRIQLVVGITDRPIGLIEEAADCVIRLGPLPDASLIGRMLFEDRLVTCASPGYLAAAGVPRRPIDLLQHRRVGYFSALNGEPMPLTFQRGDEAHDIGQAQLLSNDSTGHLNMLLAGLGIGQAYRSAVRPHLEAGTLVAILDDWQTPTAPVSILYPHARKLNRRLHVFVDWLVERLPQALG